jgi:hypothetical protein
VNQTFSRETNIEAAPYVYRLHVRNITGGTAELEKTDEYKEQILTLISADYHPFDYGVFSTVSSCSMHAAR